MSWIRCHFFRNTNMVSASRCTASISILDSIVKQCNFSHIYLNFFNRCSCCCCCCILIVFVIQIVSVVSRMSDMRTMHRFHCYFASVWLDSNWNFVYVFIYIYISSFHQICIYKLNAHSFPCSTVIYIYSWFVVKVFGVRYTRRMRHPTIFSRYTQHTGCLCICSKKIPL